MAEVFSLDDCKEDERQERYEAVGYDALPVASTDVTVDHLETINEVNDQMQEISVQRQTLCAKYFEKLDGFEDKNLKRGTLMRYTKRALAMTLNANTVT